MERQASESNEKPRDILQSMLMKRTTNESPETHNSSSQVDPDMTRQNLSYHSLEIEKETTCKEQNEDLDNTVRFDAVGEPPTKTSESEEDEAVEKIPDVFPKWERKSLLKTQSEEDKMLGTEEPMEIGAALLLNSQKESPDRQSHASPSHLSKSSERNYFSQTELKNELPLCGGGAAMQSTYQIHDNVDNRTARSVSDPVVRKPKEQRSLSDPIMSEFAMKNSTGNASAPKWRKDSGKEESFESFSKIQNKGIKSKMKTLTQKVMEMLKEKPNREHNDKNCQDCVEKETESVNSIEVEVEASSPPPLPPKKGRYVHLGRTFTLKDFRLDLEPINLMDEMFTGEEWLPFLPSKTSQPDQDAVDKAMVDNINREDKDGQIHVSQPKAKQNQPEDNRLDKKQHINNTKEIISELDSVTEVNSHIHAREVESDGDIIAIPKALLIDPGKQQRVYRIYQSGDIFDCRGMYVIPKHDLLFMKRKSMDLSSDFSAVKSSGLLDNSALKSRIRLSKKRPHRPPKKHRKLKTDCKFYKIPSVFLKESIGDSSSMDFMPISMSPPLYSNPHPAKC